MDSERHAQRTLPLTSKILYGVIPLTLVSVLLLGLSNYLVAKHQITSAVNREIKMLAHQAAENLATFFRLRQDDALTLSQTFLLRDYLKYRGYGLEEEAETYRRDLLQYFSHFAQEKKVYSSIFFLDLHDKKVAVWSLIETPQAELPLTVSFIKPGQVFNTQIRPGQERTLSYWTGVFDDQGHLAGKIVLSCDLSYVRRLLQEVQIGDHGRTFLIDSQEHALLSYRPPVPNSITAEAVIAGTPWKIRLMAKPEEFLEPLRDVQRWALLALITALILLFLWILYWARSISQPIQAMAEGTHHIASGNLDFKFLLPPIHELRVLGESFNKMTQSLKERNLELESRIRELTAIRQMEDAVIQRLDEETILRICLKAASTGLSFDRTGLYWIDPKRQEIFGRYLYGTETMGLTEENFRKRCLPLAGADILSDVVRSRASVLVKNPHAEDPRLNSAYVQESKTKEFVMAPICGKDRVFGVLAADNYHSERPLTESSKEGLTLFAQAIGLALENAVLFQDLTESEARYRTVLENSPVAILGVSKEQWITTWNLGAEKIFDYKSTEILGKPVQVLFPADSQGEFTRLLAQVMERGSARDLPIAGISKSGRKLDLSVSWGGAFSDFWLNKEWTVVIRDITESKKLQQQLIRSEKLSAVGQLISGIAHELNNPLQAVVGYSQLLAKEAVPSVKEDLHLILESAVRCRKIIDNLLLFVRHGKVEMRPTRVSQVVRSCLELLEYKLKKTQVVRVRCRIPAKLPRVVADPQQLQQVFLNLINNACDAMMETPRPKELNIRAEAFGERVRIEISDSGPGIPEDLRARIWEPFFTTKPEGRGTGLGLAICRQIVHDHAGLLELDSRPGEGTTFRIELPATTAPLKSKARRSRSSASILGKAILLVDDEPAVLGFLGRALESDRHQVDRAASLDEAMSKAARTRYDLIISDIQLKGSTGLDIYDRWRFLSDYPRPCFIFITGDVLNTNLQQLLQRRGLTCLHKPLDIEDLREALRQVFLTAEEPGRHKSQA